MIKIDKISSLISILFFILCVNHLSANDDDGSPGAFLRYGAGARAMGMGQAFVALSDDASGMYWNPAGIMRVKRFELVSMYTDLYYDSRYSYVGFVLPRLVMNPTNRLTDLFFGPSTSIGLAWVGYNMIGFEQRSITGRYLGDFDFGENALLVSWAKEWVGDWGLFRYGMTGKLVNRQFPGLLPDVERQMSANDQDWTKGMDIGLTFQPLHAPIFRIFSLKYLIPLQIGFSAQNLIQPIWENDSQQNKFPRIYRAGLSYQWNLKDWIPKSWHRLYNTLKHSQVNMAFDREIYNHVKHNYFGLEGIIPLFNHKMIWSPRWGMSNRTQDQSIGAGLIIPFSTQGLLQIDYAMGFHPILKHDQRFFVTIKIGKEKGASLFREMSKNKELGKNQIKDLLLRSIAEYPDKIASEAATVMLRDQDSTYTHRYYILTRGETKAEWLLNEAKMCLKEGNPGKAKKRAEDAVQEYLPLFMQNENPLSDQELLDFGEVLIIAQKYEKANLVLQESDEQSMRQYFLQATAYRGDNKLNKALDLYNKAIKEIQHDTGSLAQLSLLSLSEILIERYQYRAAMTSLSALLNNYKQSLDPDYPRYPQFSDDYVIDEAQFLLGICAVKSKQYRNAISYFMNVLRFYPKLEYGHIVDLDAETLIHILEDENWELLNELTNQYLQAYQELHKY